MWQTCCLAADLTPRSHWRQANEQGLVCCPDAVAAADVDACFSLASCHPLMKPPQQAQLWEGEVLLLEGW